MKIFSLHCALAAVLVLASANPSAIAGPRSRADASVVDAFIKAADGTLDSEADLVYDIDECDGAPNPVIAPDGHQVTWGEFGNVTGRASVQCDHRGTHVALKLSGLIPKGVYTVWLLTFQEPGFTPDFAHFIGEGSLGAPDGSQNSFVASANGEAALAVHHPAGALSEFGEVSACLFDEFEFHLVGAYHPDGNTYGGFPAPPELLNPEDLSCYFGYFVEHFAFEFRQE